MAPSKIDRQNGPLVVAHRGASAKHPENTLAAFQAAVDAGADVVELDVRLTADGEAVVLHDLDLSATTDGQGPVHQHTLAQVKRLNASKDRRTRTEVPTLREALTLLSGQAGVDVEIKNLPGEPSFDSPKEATVHETMRVLGESAFQGVVLISSFNWLSIERARELDASVATGFLTTGALAPEAALAYARTKGHSFVLPEVSALARARKGFIAEAHEAGLGVGTWTVDDASLIRRLFHMGVDAVATNDPETAVPVRDEFRQGGVTRPG